MASIAQRQYRFVSGVFAVFLGICFGVSMSTKTSAGTLDTYLDTQPSHLHAFALSKWIERKAPIRAMTHRERVLPLSSYYGPINYLYYAISDHSIHPPSLDYGNSELYGLLPRAVAMVQDIAQSERPLMDALLLQISAEQQENMPWFLPMAKLQHHLAAFTRLILQEGLWHSTWTNYPGDSEDEVLQSMCREREDTLDGFHHLCDELEQIRNQWLANRCSQSVLGGTVDQEYRDHFQSLYQRINRLLMGTLRAGEEIGWQQADDTSKALSSASSDDRNALLAQFELDDKPHHLHNTLETVTYPLKRQGFTGDPLKLEAMTLYRTLNDAAMAELGKLVQALIDDEVLLIELHNEGLSNSRQVAFARDSESGRVLLFQTVQMENERWKEGRGSIRAIGSYLLYGVQRLALSLSGAEVSPHPVWGIAWKNTEKFTNDLDSGALRYLLSHHRSSPFDTYPLLIKVSL